MTPEAFTGLIATLTSRIQGRPLDGPLEEDLSSLVYAPGNAHRPTVTRGRALVLYLLLCGAIEFTHT